MPPAGFEPLIPADEKLQTHAFGRVAHGIGASVLTVQVKRRKADLCCVWMSNPISQYYYSFCAYVACKINVTRLSWCIESFIQ